MNCLWQNSLELLAVELRTAVVLKQPAYDVGDEVSFEPMASSSDVYSHSQQHTVWQVSGNQSLDSPKQRALCFGMRRLPLESKVSPKHLPEVCVASLPMTSFTAQRIHQVSNPLNSDRLASLVQRDDHWIDMTRRDTPASCFTYGTEKLR